MGLIQRPLLISIFIIVKYYFVHIILLKYPLQEYRDVNPLNEVCNLNLNTLNLPQNQYTS